MIVPGFPPRFGTTMQRRRALLFQELVSKISEKSEQGLTNPKTIQRDIFSAFRELYGQRDLLRNPV